MNYNLNDVKSWPGFKPTIIAHDVGRSHDRSTAVVGGNSPYGRRLLGIGEAAELPRNLYGSSLASALAAVDTRYGRNALIVADLSNDATYAEVLYETFGPRVIGLHIGRSGDGVSFERRPVKGGSVPIYPIGRTDLLELFLSELRPIRSALPTNRRCAAPTNNLPIWKSSFVTPEQSIAARAGSTMTLASPVRCWRGRPDICIWRAG